MREFEGCAVLKRCFEAAGLHIEENVPLAGPEGLVHLDGYDAARRIGYEFITWEAADREELTPEVVAGLEGRVRAGDLHLFLIDESDVSDPAALARAAESFLAVLRQRGILP